MTNGIFICWDRPVAGREAHAAELFAMAKSLFQKRVADKTIESFEPCLVSAHGGRMNGFMLLRGEPQKLHTLTSSNEFLDLVVKCGINLEGFGVLRTYVGSAVDDMMKRWNDSL